MEIYGKSLIYVVFLLVILIIVQSLITYIQNKYTQENFINNYAATYITNMTPGYGDSSTVVKLEGTGFDVVSKIYFKLGTAMAQCIILDTRKNDTVEILPPPISELGRTVQDIRDSLKTKNKGLMTQLVFVRGTKKTESQFEDMALDPKDENVITVPRLRFEYIDRIPYKNNCEVPTKVSEPSPSIEEEETTEGEIKINYEPGSDLEFLNRILPEKESKLKQLYNEILTVFSKYPNDDNNIKKLEALQALESVKDMKKQFNIERYQIHQYLNKEYNMGLPHN